MLQRPHLVTAAVRAAVRSATTTTSTLPSPALATALAGALKSGRLLRWDAAAFPSPPASLQAAYDVQDAVAAQLHSPSQPLPHLAVAGYKIGATNEAGQKRLGLTEPFLGYVLRRDVQPLPANCAATPAVYKVAGSDAAPRLRGVELEYVFEFAADVAVPASGVVTREAVLAATARIYPGIEICGSRFTASPAAPVFATIADQASHGALLTAPHLAWSAADWSTRASDAAGLTRFPVKLTIRSGTAGGQDTVVEGDGRAVLGDPAAAVAWLATALAARRGRGIKRGDVVTSGTMTGLTPVAAGDLVEAEFTGFGSLKVALQ